MSVCSLQFAVSSITRKVRCEEGKGRKNSMAGRSAASICSCAGDQAPGVDFVTRGRGTSHPDMSRFYDESTRI